MPSGRPNPQPHSFANAQHARKPGDQHAALKSKVCIVPPPRILRQPSQNTQENPQRHQRQQPLHSMNHPPQTIHLPLQKQQPHPSPPGNIRKIIHNQRQTHQKKHTTHINRQPPSINNKQTQNRNRHKNKSRPDNHKPINKMMNPQPPHPNLTKTRNRKKIQHRSQNRHPQQISTQQKRLIQPPMSRIKHHQKPNPQQHTKKTIKNQNPTNRLPTISPHRTNHTPHQHHTPTTATEPQTTQTTTTNSPTPRYITYAPPPTHFQQKTHTTKTTKAPLPERVKLHHLQTKTPPKTQTNQKRSGAARI